MVIGYLVEHLSLEVEEAVFPRLAEETDNPVVDDRIALRTETLSIGY